MCRTLGLPDEGGEAPSAPQQGMFTISLIVGKSRNKNVNAYLNKERKKEYACLVSG